MNCLYVMVFLICLVRIQTENICLNPGDEYKYSIFTGDTLKLQCPVDSSLKDQVQWAYKEGTNQSILSIGEKLNEKNRDDSRFSVGFTNHRKNVMFLRIYNITSKEQKIYRCYYLFADRTKNPFEYKYRIRLANITNSLTKNPNGTISCVLHGRNISSIKFIWEQRTLYGEHLRFIESVKKDDLGTSKQNSNLDLHQHWISCLTLGTNAISKFNKEGEYICIAHIFIHRRSHAVNKTASIKIKNKPGEPFCIQDRRTEHSTIGFDITIAINFYSKPKYSVVSFRKNDSDLKLGDDTVNMKNISIDIYNVTVMVSGYEMIINITEFSEEDVGNYTVNISNEFGYCNCTVQLLSQGNDFPENNHTEKVVIENKTRAEITKSLQWYILACGSIIVVLFAMSALRSIFLKTVNNCSKPTIRKPCCHKSTEKQATKKQATKKPAAKKPRRAYSDQFMEVTLNQLHNGERVLIIGQTNEMDASTETNI